MNYSLIKKLSIPLFTLIAFSVAFYTPIQSLLKEWGRPEYSHGIILPLISIWLGWHKAAGYKKPIKSSWLGLFTCLLGVILLCLSELSTFRQLSFYALATVLLGLNLTYLGRALTLKMSAAFILLLFSIPLPAFLFNTLSVNLQLISSSLGVFLIELMNIPVFQNGNVIDLGTYKLQVVEACNGLRYLFPLISFSFLMAYLFKDKLWKRAIVFLSAIPLAIGMNSVRIAIAGLLTTIWGPQSADGFVHMFEGVVVFAICVSVLMLEIHILEKIGKKSTFHWDILQLPQEKLTLTPAFTSKISAAVLALSILASVGVVTGWGLANTVTETIQTHLNQFPLKLGGWQGKASSIDSVVLSKLKLTDYWIADYKQENQKPPINLYIAYYGKQELLSSIHAPSTCIPGGGWKIMDTSETIIPIENKYTVPLHATRMLIQKGDHKQIVYFWFDGRGRIITSQLSAKWFLLIDSLTKQRSDGALVRFTSPVEQQESEEDADQRIVDFIKESYSDIRRRIP